jgi:hypothetical protein
MSVEKHSPNGKEVLEEIIGHPLSPETKELIQNPDALGRSYGRPGTSAIIFNDATQLQNAKYQRYFY